MNITKLETSMQDKTIEILTFTNGPFGVNSYLLSSGNYSVIIDPGHDCSELIDFTQKRHEHPSLILFTHGHIDHVCGTNQIIGIYPSINIISGFEDADLLSNIKMQAKMFSLPEPELISSTKYIKDNEDIVCGDIIIRPFHTPGHSMGSYSFLCGNALFSGDVIFRESIGRTDLFGGNHSILMKTLREKIMTLPDSCIIYPGHGEPTTIGHERKNNPYI